MADLVIFEARAARDGGNGAGKRPLGGRITLVLTGVDEVMAILRRDPPAVEPESEVAS